MLCQLSYEATMAVPTGIEPAIPRVTGECDNRYTTEPLVAGEGFEPSTFGLWAQRATRLLYPAISNFKLAEEKGFEPLRRFPDLPVFKTGPFNQTWVFLQEYYKHIIGAPGRTWTGTGFNTRGILSPLRLPIPPPRQHQYI